MTQFVPFANFLSSRHFADSSGLLLPTLQRILQRWAASSSTCSLLSLTNFVPPRLVYRNFFNQDYYEFGMDWTEKSITMWVRSRVRIAFRYGFGKKRFWDLGKRSTFACSLRISRWFTFVSIGNFGYSYPTGEIIANPWAGSENPHVAPFDQNFYLRIALLAGGTDGYWLDSLENKPYRNSDDRQAGMARFWNWIGVWAPTWPAGEKIRERGMAIDSVKMYQKC